MESSGHAFCLNGTVTALPANVMFTSQSAATYSAVSVCAAFPQGGGAAVITAAAISGGGAAFMNVSLVAGAVAAPPYFQPAYNGASDYGSAGMVPYWNGSGNLCGTVQGMGGLGYAQPYACAAGQ